MPNEQDEQAQDTPAEGEAFDFDTWLGEQPEQVRKGYESRTTGLRSALESERQQRKEFAKQLRDATLKAEKGSELEKALGETSTRLEQAEQRAVFYEEGSKPEIGCSNLKAAFLVAQADGLFTKRGDPDWTAIKAAAPELFGRKTPPGNAGSGSGDPPPVKVGMNDWIRKAARGG